MRTGFAALAADDFGIHYEEYRSRLDAQAVLDHYGAENQSELLNRDGETIEILHSCLLDREEPHHRNADQSPSACCNLDKKTYVCFGYWGGDLFHLIMKLEHKGSLDAIVPLLGQFLGDAVKEPDVFLERAKQLFASARGGSYAYEMPSYSELVLASWAFLHPYVSLRGIDIDTASRMHIGWDELDNRITIPHFWRGKLVGWQKRAIPAYPGEWPGTQDPMPKYKNSSGFPKAETLYNYDAVMAHGTDLVIVVESPFSVIKAEALGIHNVVATFGASTSTHQHDLLKRFKWVVVWMDGDTSGRVAERRLVRNLYHHTNVRVVEADVARDLADYASREHIEAKLDAAVAAVKKTSQWDRETP